MNFGSIDPGKTTGISVFSNKGEIMLANSLADNGKILDYLYKLQAIRDNHNIKFAIIERFVQFKNSFRKNAYKVEGQIRACMEVFPSHIMICSSQWNPMKLNKTNKKLLFMQYFPDIEVPDEHGVDAGLMGIRVWKATSCGIGKPFEALSYLAETKRKWPTLQEPQLHIFWHEHLKKETE